MSIFTEIAEIALDLQVNVRLIQDQCDKHNIDEIMMTMALKSEEMGHIHSDYNKLAAKIIHKRHIYILQNSTL